jgi:lipopolysaccharide transport system ATP-binding protein
VIGGKDQLYGSFREMLGGLFTAPFRRFQTLSGKAQDDERFWALKDIDFDIQQGEVLGVIGKNGAGKSTLLKILSRITSPTLGRVVIRGRVASLLEVGTGFHPELTGRENIFLNGSILGMAKKDIDCRFDEIVSFAEIEKFVDTPVKRYSSGMYVRLAFAVAAHLEPDILIVDEVLAVGDASFQNKCLGKMQDVIGEGRTILFVSHNMQAIQGLCPSVCLLENGEIAGLGPSKEVVSQYLSRNASCKNEMSWNEDNCPGNQELKLLGIRVTSATGVPGSSFLTSDETFVEFSFELRKKISGLCIGFDLVDEGGCVVLRSYQTDMAPNETPAVRLGFNRFRCVIPGGLLNGGRYFVSPRIGVHNFHWIVYLDSILTFELALNHGISPYWNSLSHKSRPGIIAPLFDWKSVG